jgi:signal transduction histidine kinase
MGAGLNIRLRRKDGSDLSADVSLSPLATAESRVVLATIRDVSDRREAEERLRRSEERFRLQASRLEAIAEVTRAILESRGGEEVLQIVASRARELVDAAVACVMTPDESGETLLIRVADGDMAAELVGATLPADGWFGPSLIVPLGTEEHVLGAVTVGNHTGGALFTDDDLHSLELFCAQASVALEHGRIRSQLQRLAVVEDRERIARELHDGIVQALFAVGLGLLSAEPIATDQPVKARLHEAVDSIDRVIADLRRYIFGLKPHAVSMDALGNAVMTLASEFQARTQIVTAVDIDRRLEDRSGDQVAEVVQVAREALSNVARHAHATTCRVSLRYEPPDAVLEIDDDGRGFDLEAVPGHGYGLDNLRERAAGLGGTLELASNPGQGTTMRLTFPIDPQPAPAGG